MESQTRVPRLYGDGAESAKKEQKTACHACSGAFATAPTAQSDLEHGFLCTIR